MLLATSVSFVGCSDDDLSSTSVITDDTTEKSKFDNWLYKNYVEEYNIDFKYRYSDKEADRNYNVYSS